MVGNLVSTGFANMREIASESAGIGLLQRKRSTKGVGVWAGRGMSVSGPPWPAESGLESVTKQYPPGDRP